MYKIGNLFSFLQLQLFENGKMELIYLKDLFLNAGTYSQIRLSFQALPVHKT